MDGKNDINIKLVEKIYQRKVIMFDDWGLGLHPYVYDENAVKDGPSTTTNLAGANWLKGKDLGGNVKEIYGRPIPDYFNNLDKVHQLEKKIEEMGKSEEYISELKKTCTTEFELVHATAQQKCKAILNCIENSR